MKLYKSILLGGAMLLGGLFTTGCQNSFNEPEIEVPVAKMQPNTTIAELKADFWTSETNYASKCPLKDEATNTPYIIHGRVISSDAAGNVYKSLYIQDETAAITLSINQASLYNEYRIGQEIVLNVTGLYIGKYAGLEQVGGFSTYNGTPQVSFMPYIDFTGHSELNGLPQTELTYVNYGEALPSKLDRYCIVCKISDLPTDEDGSRAMMSQYIELRNVHFETGGQETFASKNVTESRNLVDESGNTIVVRTSGYSTFFNETLPKGTGTVRGLLSYFNGTWQLILNSIADCVFNEKGQVSDPYTVAEAIELEGTGASGWVKGYIVGSVAIGVTEVKSNEDIIWSNDADRDDNIVIAANPDCKNIEECLILELKQGSVLREKANLRNNPGVYGQEIKVRGTFDRYLGANGIVGNNGSYSEFELEGVTPATPTPPASDEAKGTGTAADPFNVVKALQMCEQTGSTQTAESYYTAGYVISGSIDTSYGNGTWKIADNPQGTGKTITVFRAKDLNDQKFTDANKVKVGDYIVVYAPLINYMGNTPETNYGYLYSINGGNTPSTPDTPDTPSVGQGDGTENSPFSVTYAAATTADATGVWVEGYIVGWVDGQVYSSGCRFNGESTSQTNLLLAASPSETDATKCIPVQLPAGNLRTALNLNGNPSNYKKHIKLYGDITKYFGVRGFKNTSKYSWID